MALVVENLYCTNNLSVSNLRLDQQHISSVGFGIIEPGELLAIRQTFHSLSVFASVVREQLRRSVWETDTKITIYLKVYLWTITDLNLFKLFDSIQSMRISSVQKSDYMKAAVAFEHSVKSSPVSAAPQQQVPREEFCWVVCFKLKVCL